jgi:hypothetical protein
MISISPTLQAAAISGSRQPISKIAIEPVSLMLEEINGISLPYSIHTIRAGDGYFIATAYNPASSTVIYYKRLTSVTEAADWNAGWSTLDTLPNNIGAKYHDCYIDGDNVIIAYQKDFAEIYARESNDGGQTWGAAALAVDLTATENRSNVVSIASLNVMYIGCRNNYAYTDHIVHRAYRSAPGNPWSTTPWDKGRHFLFLGTDIGSENFFARDIGYDEMVAINLWRGQEGARWYNMHRARITNGAWGPLERAYGTMPTTMDYSYNLAGMSRLLNGWYFAGIGERYLRQVDYRGIYWGDDSEAFHLAKTKDLWSYSLIPLEGFDDHTHYIAGVVQDGDYMCIPIKGADDTIGSVYLAAASNWFGSDATAVDVTDRVSDAISLQRTHGNAVSAQINVSNFDDSLTNDSTIREGSIVKVSAGYNTGVDELQQRFTGVILGNVKTTGQSKNLNFTVMDKLHYASAVKQHRSHVIAGQNSMYVDFSRDDDVDWLIPQCGPKDHELTVDSSRLKYAGVADKTTIYMAALGHEPDDCHVIQAKVRCSGSISGVKMGVILHMDYGGGGATVAYWDSVETEIVVAHLSLPDMDVDGEEDPSTYIVATVYDISVYGSGLEWIVDTDYWIAAYLRQGEVDVWFGDGSGNWNLVLSGVEIGMPGGNEAYPENASYVGVYCEIEGETPTVYFDDLLFFSGYKSPTYSDVMGYLAGLCGLGTNEHPRMEDEFPGSSFSSDWETPGVDGTWSVSGGYAKGRISGIDPSAIRCNSVYTTDVIAKTWCNFEASANSSGGIIIRADDDLDNCYAGIIGYAMARIYKRAGGAWTQLCNVGGHGPWLGLTEIAFCGRGPFLSLYANGVLEAWAYDEDFTEGYVGLATMAVNPYYSNHDIFRIDALSKPCDIVIVRPNDNALKIMQQVASTEDGVLFFCDHNGDLEWGVYKDETVDLDLCSSLLTFETKIDLTNVLTSVYVEGEKAFADVRDNNWGQRLAGHRYSLIQDKSLRTKDACASKGQTDLHDSQRITKESITAPGQPAIEVGDVIAISELPGNVAWARRVFSYNETIGPGVYEMQFGELQTTEAQTPWQYELFEV